MTLVPPKPGEIIRYSYLWRQEHEAGHEEGIKDRPCAVVMSIAGRGDSARIIVLPITHTPPTSGVNAIEIPIAVKRRLGLDDARSWIVLDEANRFTWPGPDIRPFEASTGRTVSYGFLPPGLFKNLTQSVSCARLGRRCRARGSHRVSLHKTVTQVAANCRYVSCHYSL